MKYKVFISFPAAELGGEVTVDASNASEATLIVRNDLRAKFRKEVGPENYAIIDRQMAAAVITCKAVQTGQPGQGEDDPQLDEGRY